VAAPKYVVFECFK